MTREDQLIKQCKAGEPEALDALVQMYYTDILRYCLWHAPDRQSAEDATHETFLKMIRHLSGYTHRGHFRAFLYRIAANTCVDMQRSKWSSTAALPENLIAEECGYRKAEEDADFQRLVACLPQEQRELVLLRFAQQLTLRELAEITGLPLRTVQSRLRAALKKIKSSLSEGGWE